METFEQWLKGARTMWRSYVHRRQISCRTHPLESKFRLETPSYRTGNLTPEVIAPQAVKPFIIQTVEKLTYLGFTAEQLDRIRNAEIRIDHIAGWKLAVTAADGTTVNGNPAG